MLLITAVKDDRNLKHHVSKIGYDLSFQEELKDQNCYPQDRSKVWNGVHVSLSDLVYLVCMPRSGIVGSYGSSISSFLSDLHTDFTLSTGRFFKDQTGHSSVKASICNHLSCF